MNSFRCVLTLAALVLLGGLAPAWSQDKVLVPGDPPLTQKMVDQYQERWQWYCDVQLSDKQRKDHQRLLIAFWQKKNRFAKQQLADSYSRNYQVYQDDLRLNGQEQEQKRERIRSQWLAVLRRDADPANRYLTGVYDDAHKPGGPNNPLLLVGNPPLTRVTVDQGIVFTEWLLDAPLTDEQRQEYQRLLLLVWKQWDRAKKAEQIKTIAGNAELLQKASPYQRHFFRSTNLQRVLAAWGKADADAVNRWRLGLYRDVSKPGSKRNPVLVDGKSPLTQEVVDRYGDYVEVMLDLSVSGGLTVPQRQVLQEYLVKDWKKINATVSEEMLADLKRWADAAGQGVGEAGKQVGALRPKLLAQLETADDARSKWLLEIAAQERKKEELLSEAERQRHEAMMKLIDNLRPSGSWRYNPVTGRHEWRP